MYSIQRTLLSFLRNVLPYHLVKRREALAYEQTILSVHALIVESTRDPKTRRPGCSLHIAAIDILSEFKQTSDVFHQAAVIYDELARRGHYFTDGNKRTAHCMAKAHLFSHGYHFKVDYRYAVPFIEKIADGQKSLKTIRSWLMKHSSKYHDHSADMYLKKLIKEMTVYEKRGRPAKDGGKRFQAIL